MVDKSNSSLTALFTSGSIVFGGLVLQLVINFGAKLVIARFLGKTGYGSVALGITTMTMLSILVLIGTDTGIGRYLPRYDEPADRRGVLISAFQIVVPVSILTGIAVFVSADSLAKYVFSAPSIAPVLRTFGIAIPLAAFVRLTIGTVRGMQESLPKVYIQNISLPVSRFLLIGVVLSLGLKAIGIAWAYVLAYGIAGFLSTYYLYKYTPLLDDTPANSMHRELLAFSAPVMVTASVNTVFSNIDTFLLGYFSTTGDVGIYNVVYPIASMLTVTLNAFGFVFMPEISSLHSEGEVNKMKRIYRIFLKWGFLGTFPIFLLYVSSPRIIIRSTFGVEYIDGALALAILSLGFLLHAVFGITGSTLTALGESQLVMRDNLFVAVTNILLNVVLIPKYSYVGAAVATAAGYVIMDGLYVIQLYRLLGIHPFTQTFLRSVFAALFSGSFFYFGVSLLSLRSLPLIIGIFPIFIVGYISTVFVVGGIEQEELLLLEKVEKQHGVNIRPIKRILKRFAR